jgi:hypothetical protein
MASTTLTKQKFFASFFQKRRLFFPLDTSTTTREQRCARGRKIAHRRNSWREHQQKVF